MTEKEYREFLEAVGKRHVRLHRETFGPGGPDHFRTHLEGLGRTYRLVRVVSERPDETSLYELLGGDLKHNYIGAVFAALQRSGVSEALDEHGEIIFPNLSMEVVPSEDIAFLREAGVPEPEAELVILVHHARSVLQSTDAKPSEILKLSSDLLLKVASELAGTPQTTSRKEAKAKPRKILNGIGKILSGAIAGAGNLLIGIGAIPVSGGAAGAAVIASCAVAVSAVAQGWGDLRGE